MFTLVKIKIMQLYLPCLLLLLLAVTHAEDPGSQPDSVLPMPFGSAALDVSVPRSDDLSSAAHELPPLSSGRRGIRFLGGTFTSWFLNNNGHLSFDTAYASFRAESVLPAPEVPPLVAAFWTDLDTRGGGSDENQLWLRTSQSADDRFAASRIVMQAPGADPNFRPAAVCVATWKEVAYRGGGPARNTFQIVLAYDESQTWLILGYERLEVNPDMPATVGLSYTLGASGQILTTLSSQEEMNAWLGGTNLRTGVWPGVYAYRVDEPIVTPIPPPPDGETSFPLVPFGLSAGDVAIPGNDDGSSDAFELEIPMFFVTDFVRSWHLNTNGHISFDETFGFTTWTPLPSREIPAMIAIFWTDIDTRVATDGGNELWARSRGSTADLTTCASVISNHPDGGNFFPSSIAVATWNRVLPYSGTGVSSFQLILAFDRRETWAIFIYGELGYSPAGVGFNGPGGLVGEINVVEDNDEVNALLQDTNCGRLGVYCLSLSAGPVPTDPPIRPSDLPTPFRPTIFPSFVGPEPPPREDMLFPFGEFAVNDVSIPPNDDGSSNQIFLRVPMSFYGVEVESFWVNTNGHISFESSYSATTASRLPSSIIPTLVAPYWTDINTFNGGFMWARISIGERDLVTASELISRTGAVFIPDSVLVATWDRVAAFGSSGPERNSFQAIIAYASGGETYVIFYYGRLEFHRGLTGVGLNAFEGSTGLYQEIGNDSEMRDLLVGSNVGLSGVYIYNVTSAGLPQDDLAMLFGAGAGDERIPGSDDGSSSQFELRSPMWFFGEMYRSWFLNTNGILSFGRSFGSPTPVILPAEGADIVAAYWVDIDTRPTSAGEHEMWARTSSSGADLRLAAQYVSGHPDAAGFSPTEVAVGTWHKVMPFGGGPNRSSFQATMAYNRIETWAILSYGRLEFYQGGAGIGFSNADGNAGFNVSLIESDLAMQRLLSGTNCGFPGVYAYRVSETSTPAPSEAPTSTPQPVALPFEFGVRDIALPGNDDGSYGPYTLPQPMIFLGSNVSAWYMNTNGHLSFDQRYSSTSPSALPNPSIPGLIAVYWTDIYTGNGGFDQNELWVRGFSTNEDRVLAADIVRGHPDGGSFIPAATIVATWYRVEAFGSTPGRNTFQAVIAYNEVETWAILSYGQLEFHRNGAGIGFNSPDGEQGGIVRLIDSDFNMTRLLLETNCGRPGTYAYMVSGQPSPIDLPFAFGEEASDTPLARGDDSPHVGFELTIPMRFFGSTQTAWYVNINGHVSLGESYSAYVPQSLPDPNVPNLAAIYWTDINTGNGGEDQNEIWGRTSTAPVDLSTAEVLVSGHPAGSFFRPLVVGVATWYKVSPLGGGPSLNTFQMAIAYNRVETWAIFVYNRLEYYLSGAGTGFNAPDVGAGFNFGFVNSTSGMASLLNGTNCGEPGVYAFLVSDSGSPSPPPSPIGPPVTEPPQPCVGGVTIDTITFPESFDIREFQSGDRPWNEGDFLVGSRMTSIGLLTRLDFDLAISPNGLSSRCGFQNTSVTVNGFDVGDFSITSSDNLISRSYTFPPIEGPIFEIRLETLESVASGCGAAGIPNGESFWNLYASCSTSSPFPTSQAPLPTPRPSIGGTPMPSISARPSSGSIVDGDRLPMPFGLAAGDAIIPVSDDGHSEAFSLPNPMIFLGDEMSQFFVNNNGLVSFDSGFGSYIPESLPSTNVPAIVAAYWTDIDTKPGGAQENEVWGRTSTAYADLWFASFLISGHPDGISFTPDAVAVATWHAVGPYGGGSERSSFQVTMAYNSVETWIILAYARLEFFGSMATVGFNSRSGRNGENLFSVGNSADMNALLSGTNCRVDGTYAFKVSSSPATFPTQSPAPEGLRTNEPTQSFPPGPSLTPPPSTWHPSVTWYPTSTWYPTVTSWPTVTDSPNYSTSDRDRLPFRFDSGLGDSFIGGNDDGFSEAFDFPFSINFYGNLVNSWVLNTNGGLSFDGGLPLVSYVDGTFPNADLPALIAVYWVDINTQGGGVNQNELWARTSTSDEDISIASSIVNSHPDGGSFTPEVVAVATWYRVAAFGGGSERNTFQAILASEGSETWVILAYAQLEFYRGGATVGLNSAEGIFGESIATIGSVADMQEWLSGSNCGFEGVYAFRVSRLAPEPSVLPLPFGLAASDNLVPGNDDGSSLQYFFPEPVNFYGSSVLSWYANTNGVISFDTRLSSTSYVNGTFPVSFYPALIAVYWVDINTVSGGVSENELWARTSTSDDDISVASSIVNSHPDGGSFFAEVVAVATWNRVAPFGGGPDRNTFQAILATSGSETWVILAYTQLEFYQSGATVGLNGADGSSGLSVATIGSDVEMREWLGGSNCGIEGVYAFPIPASTPLPTPGPPSIFFIPSPRPTPGPLSIFPSPRPTRGPPSRLPAPSAEPRITRAPVPETVVDQDRLLFSFGPAILAADGSTVDERIAVSDDGSSESFELSTPMLFYGENVTQFFINNNGHASFNQTYSSYTPVTLPNPTVPALIAVYWTDIDTRGRGTGQNELWARTDASRADVAIANRIISGHPASDRRFEAQNVAVATWHRVEGFNLRGQYTSFQLAMAYNERESWVILFYGRLEYFGAGAGIGFNSFFGSRGNLTDVVSSEADMARLLTGTNCDYTGAYAFRVGEL